MGNTNLDNKSTTLFEHAAAVAQYDPVLKDGVLSWITKGRDERLEYFIWDRPLDNKLYARFSKPEKACGLENYVNLHQIMLFFDSESVYWPVVPENMMARFCQTDIQADLNHDCKVDIDDLSIFVSNWLTDESIEYKPQGDIDGNKMVDAMDLMIMSEQWLSRPAEPSADIAPAPNGDGIVDLNDFSILCRYWLLGN